jgi:Anti-sigma-K factor rskA
MARELTPRELQELLAAHALDAVDGDEREQLERYLAREPEARAALADLREVASLLAHPKGDAPAELWHRIDQSLAAEPPRLVLPLELAPARRARPVARRVVAALVAAGLAGLATTVVLLSRDVSRQQDKLAQLGQRLERGDARDAAFAMAADPHARSATLTWRDGHPSVTVVAMPDGRGYLMADDLPRLQRGHTYQLWAMSGDRRNPDLVSTAVLGRDPGVAAFHGPGSAFGFVLTNERSPGVQRARGPVVAAGQLDT